MEGMVGVKIVELSGGPRKTSSNRTVRVKTIRATSRT